MATNDIINILSKFRYVDKYQSFKDILPSVVHSAEDQKIIVTQILDHCCNELLEQFRNSKKPTKPLLKQSLIECMDAIAIAKINAENKEFGYQLGWYLAEKVNVNLKKGTEKKLWGYWQIEGSEVKMPVKPRIAPKVKEKAAAEKKKTSKKKTEVV